MKDIQKEIIAYIKRNRVSTTEVADCLGKTGAVANVHAVNRGHFCVGAVRYILVIRRVIGRFTIRQGSSKRMKWF